MPSRSLCLLLLLAPAALAHEFWLEAPAYRLLPGQPQALRPLVGQQFAGQPWRGTAAKVARFVRFGPAPADSAALALADTLRLTPPGTHTVLLRTNESFIELPATQFDAYLKEEGLDFPLAQRQAQGAQAGPGREAYRRCAKALLHVGAAPPAADTAWRRPHGLPLELLPEQNPYRLAPGAALTVRVLRAGQPLRGALVQVWERQPAGAPARHFAIRTNSAGRILLRLPSAGPYLLACVDMQRAPAALRPRADWLSTWASLTFGGSGSAARPGRGY